MSIEQGKNSFPTYVSILPKPLPLLSEEAGRIQVLHESSFEEKPEVFCLALSSFSFSLSRQ